MQRASLTRRLALAAVGLIAGGLLIAGLLLIYMFRDHIERRFDRALADQMSELIAASDVDLDGNLVLAWTPVDPRFNRPGSGWYWQIEYRGAIVRQSLSLQRMTLGHGEGANNHAAQTVGPTGEPLRVLARSIALPGAEGRLVYVLSGPESDIAGDVGRFSAITAMTLAALGLALAGAVLVQVRFGLRPLVGLRRALADIRAGRAHRMPRTFPGEVEPIVDELNAVLDHNAALLARARTHAGNLAHALKHPLTVLKNEARLVDGDRGHILMEQIDAMRASIDRNLSRARAAGPGGALGIRTDVAETIEGLRFSLDLLYRGQGIAITVEGVEGLFFAGDGQDFEEMLGNLMDNACKWARTSVRVRGENRADRLVLAVEDDGPGIPTTERESVLLRGRRLDESVPGAGLGLDIVRDIAELYRGTVRLDESETLGGLRVRIELPAAESGAD